MPEPEASRRQRSRFSWLANMSLLLLSLLAGMLLMELALRFSSPVEMRVKSGETLNLPYYKTYNLQGGKNSKLEREFRSSRNSLGFRGQEPPRDFQDYLSIIAIGGSTTECFYVADGFTWPEIVGDLLTPLFDRLWINNAGLLGHSTYGHLVLLRQHVTELAPKAALFLVGINDRTREGLTSIEESMKQQTRSAFKTWLFRHSELASLAWSVYRTLSATNLGIGKEEIHFDALPQVKVSAEARAAELAKHGGAHLDAYADRLREMIGLSLGANIFPVLITQPAIYGPAIDDTTGADLGLMKVNDINGLVSWEVLELYNGVTRKVAKETKTALIELAHELPKSSRFYYDYIHFTREGSQAVAEIIAKRLCPILAAKFPKRRRKACP